MNHYSRIACLSTSRADAGIFRPLLRAMALDARFEPTLVTSHDDVHLDLPGVRGINVAHGHGHPGDDAHAVAMSTGGAVGVFAEALIEVQPDLVFVLGDRTEMLAAALAATICTLPIAHLHGGDTTLGAYDDTCRHAITKLSHLHFPALAEHARAVRALGEAPNRIHVVGALAIDELMQFRPEPIADCSAAVGLDLHRPTILVVFHPETVCDLSASSQVERIVHAIRSLDGQILWIEPNADVGHGAIREAMASLSVSRIGVSLLSSVSQGRFWSCLVHCTALVGNSSAGLIEAASLERPVVNIGRRQQGRVRAGNVIDVGFDPAEIARTLARATSLDFQASLAGLTNPYGDGNAASRIVAALASLPDRLTLLRKPPPASNM